MALAIPAAPTPLLQTERAFTLPFGYADEHGNLHKQGTMRLATALDEVEPLADPRTHANQAYVGILLLSRVITQLGAFRPVPPAVIEGLFSADFVFLQDLFIRLNDSVTGVVETQCPSCGGCFAIDVAGG